MNLPTRHMLLGMTLGAICATALAATGPGIVFEAFADEVPTGFDTSGLVKFDGHDYQVSYEDWVDTTPLSVERIKKVEGGRVTYVTVTHTSTGVYSSDAMTAPNVQYPGIQVARDRGDDLNGNSPLGSMLYLSTADRHTFAIPALRCTGATSLQHC
jgi:hypothetical protein